ncbi:MAG: VWA domain-containing protein [bacterium]
MKQLPANVSSAESISGNANLKKIFVIIGLFLLLFILFFGAYFTWKWFENKDVVATVDNIKITKQDISRQSELDKKMGEYLKDPDFNMGVTAQDAVTEAALLRVAAKDNNISVSEKEIQDSVKALADRSYSGSMEDLYRGHQELLGLTKEEVNKNHETLLYKEKIKNLVSTHSGEYIAVKTDTINSSDEIAKKTIDGIKAKLDSGEILKTVYQEYAPQIEGAISTGAFDQTSPYSLSAAGVELNHYSGVAQVDNEYVVVFLKQESKKQFETYEELLKYYKDNDYKTSFTDKLLSDVLFVSKAFAHTCGCDTPECKKWDPYTVTKCDTTSWTSYPVTACGPSASCAIDTCKAPYYNPGVPAGYTKGYMCDFSATLSNTTYGCKAVTVPTGTPNVYTTSTCDNKCVLPENPKIIKACGLDITLIIDHSGSISSNNLNKVIDAFKGFVTSLKDTPTNFSVIDFSSNAHIIQNFTNDTKAVTRALDSIKSMGAGSTNWLEAMESATALFDNTDRFAPKGVKEVLERPGYQNLVIIATDGNPTSPCGDGGYLNTTDVMEAAKAANILKTVPARIVSFGINEYDMNVNNLKLISGPIVDGKDIVDTDVITTDFNGLTTKFHEYASESCQGTITVKKEVDGKGVKDWEFNVDGKVVKTGEDGMVNVLVGLKKFSVVEVPKTGYNFDSAACTGAVENGILDKKNSKISNISVSPTTVGAVCNFASTAPSTCKIKSVVFNPQSAAGSPKNPTLSVELENSKSGKIDFGNGTATVNNPNLNGITTLTPTYSRTGIFVATATCVGSDGVSHSDNAIFQLQDVPASGSCSFEPPPKDKIISNPPVTGPINQSASNIDSNLDISFSANLTGIQKNGFISWELWHEGSRLKTIPGEAVNNPSMVLSFAGTDQPDGAWGAGTYKLILRASGSIDKYGNAVGNCGSVIDFTIDHAPECHCTISPIKSGIAPQKIMVGIEGNNTLYENSFQLVINNSKLPPTAIRSASGVLSGEISALLKNTGKYYIAVEAKRSGVGSGITDILPCNDPTDTTPTYCDSNSTGLCNYTVTNRDGGGGGEVAL